MFGVMGVIKGSTQKRRISPGIFKDKALKIDSFIYFKIIDLKMGFVS
jgi:hypothetical protein